MHQFWLSMAPHVNNTIYLLEQDNIHFKATTGLFKNINN